MQRWSDRLLQALARLVLRVFFRRLEIEGREQVPADRPALVVANHVNSLIDAVLLVAALPRMPRFLAKSTLWEMKPLLPFLKLGGVIPVYRRQDEGVDHSKNAETFARSHETLAAGGMIALFPEGKSHNEPELQPLKTGAARIVLETEERFGPLGVRLVPAGLVFDAKESFRSRALVRFGEAIVPEPPFAGEDPEDFERVRRLTARIDEGLRRVTPNYGSWAEARLLERAVDLWAVPESKLPARARLSDRVPLRSVFHQGFRKLREEYPEPVARVEDSVRRYDELLATCGLRDDQVAASYPPHLVARYLWHTFLLLLLRLPAAIVGTLLNWLPYRIPGWVAARVATEPDMRSSYKLFTAVFVFPLFWTLETALAWHYLGPWAALATLVLAPSSGWVALRFHERRGGFLAEARAYLLLRRRQDLTAELKTRRQEVQSQVAELVELYQREADAFPT